MVLVNVPIEPELIVPKLHAVGRGVLAMTAPRGCMTSGTLWGVSAAAYVVMGKPSLKAEAWFGSATRLGMILGVIVRLEEPPIAICVGTAIAGPVRTNEELAPLPRVNAVTWNV